MQAAGFYLLSEEDARGEARPILYDRNWTVVSQSPKPGTRAPLDRTIILRAKKDGEWGSGDRAACGQLAAREGELAPT